VVLTSAHPVDDVRLRGKIARSFADMGCEVFFVGPTDTAGLSPDGVQVVPIRPGRRRLGRMLFGAAEAAIRAMRCRADLYWFADPELLPWALLMRAAGARLVYDAHEDSPRAILTREYLPELTRRLTARSLEVFEDLCARRMAHVVAATPAIGTRFRLVNSDTIVLNNYPWLSEIASDEAGPSTRRDDRVVYVGGISRERGIMEMIRAMESLPASSRLRLDLVGQFETPELLAEARLESGWNRVDFHGPLPRAEARDIMRRGTIGLIVFQPVPNHTSAQPNKLFEYMAAGLPVVASDFDLWESMLAGEESGITVNPMNPMAIGEALAALEAAPARAREMGSKGSSSVRNRFNWEAEVDKLKQMVDGSAQLIPA
jgi:glycosyltransferase involved in cell wall biosynthesis